MYKANAKLVVYRYIYNLPMHNMLLDKCTLHQAKSFLFVFILGKYALHCVYGTS